MFAPQVSHALTIDGVVWKIAPHPFASGMPYGQEGRAAVVYQLVVGDHAYEEDALILREGGPPFLVPPDGSAVRVGRGSRDVVSFSQPAVSREHGAFVMNKGHLFFWDNSSRNGTLVDGKRIEPQQWVPVPPGSRVQLGALEEGAALSVRPHAGSSRALKVFKPRFRVPRMVDLSGRLAAFSALPGLRVCERRVLTPQEHRDLLEQEPELVYSVVMPWIEGRTWMEHVVERLLLEPSIALDCATRLVDILARMEQSGVAHCDLSGPNVALRLLPGTAPELELLDVEQLYGPGLSQPEDIFAGSPGYAHRNLGGAAWSAVSDRFSGAVLVAEMLAWCDPGMVEAAWSESFFEPSELQTDCERYRRMRSFLAGFWGARVGEMFDAAWFSEGPESCPTFGDWMVALPSHAPVATPAPAPPRPPVFDEVPEPAPAPGPPRPSQAAVQSERPIVATPPEMATARRLETAGDPHGALLAYRRALDSVPPESAVGRELAAIVEELEATLPPEVPTSPQPTLVDPELLRQVRELEGEPGLSERRPTAPTATTQVATPPTFSPAVAALIGALLMAVLLLGGILVWLRPWK